MLSFIIFSVTAYGLAVLIADAKIFGVPAASFPESPTREDFTKSAKVGILRVRQYILRVGVFRKLLSCYLCLGVWCGMGSHWLMYLYALVNTKWRDSYFLWGQFDLQNMIISTIIAAVIGGPVCYAIDLGVTHLEKGASDPEEWN